MLNIVLLMDTSTAPGDFLQIQLLLEPGLDSLPSLEICCAIVAIHVSLLGSILLIWASVLQQLAHGHQHYAWRLLTDSIAASRAEGWSPCLRV